MSSSIITLVVIGVGIAAFVKRCDWLGICGDLGSAISGSGSGGKGGSSSTPDTSSSGKGGKGGKGGYSYGKGGGGKGGYIGTPGWYTLNGHHHCNMGESGCVCTDPKKCCRTGYPPRNASECRPDKGRYGAGPQSLCNCAPYAGGKSSGYSGYTNVSRGYSAYSVARDDDYPPIDVDDNYISDDIDGRYIDLGICVRGNRLVYSPIPLKSFIYR